FPRSQLAYQCHRPPHRHPHSPSPNPVLGRVPATQTPTKSLARNPGKILPLTQSHFVPPTSLILNSRRHCHFICLTPLSCPHTLAAQASMRTRQIGSTNAAVRFCVFLLLGCLALVATSAPPI